MIYDFLNFFDPKKISSLNDDFRKNIHDNLDRLDLSLDIEKRSEIELHAILNKIQSFNQFTKEHDPYGFGYHHWGSFNHNGEEIVWIFEYYDQDMYYCSLDPSNPDMTTRILQIKTGEEFWT